MAIVNLKTQRSLLVITLVCLTTFSGVYAAKMVQERQSKKVKRVKRPVFGQPDWDGIYFEDLYKEGLVGPRPAKIAPGAMPIQPSTVASTNGGGAVESEGGFAWSKFVSSSTIEDEVKALQTSLVKDVTTPVKFKSDYAKVHQSFSMLSMLFGIVREYDDDVRWKRFAPSAQASFERAAANSRVGTIQAYESCKRRKDDLVEMVRGGNFAGEEKPPEQLDWSAVVERSPIMDRLQVSYDLMKQTTSSEGEFAKSVDQIRHEAELVAAMSQTLMKENMTDADDEGYLEFAKSMSDAAVLATKACAEKDYDGASRAVNLIGQSCSNCHDEWR